MLKSKYHNLKITLISVGLICVGLMIYLYFKAEPNSIEVIKLRLEIVKIVLVSVVVWLLGIIIPNELANQRHETEMKLAKERVDLEKERQTFELKKEGRRLYSIVSTGFKYLSYRLSVMEYEEAMKYLENIHQAII
ncbi:MAG: hypothetical protein IPM82_16200 [Saprospiraceae bacterium]|nr:hypothetical protein [Saprospiraceae bacterium]